MCQRKELNAVGAQGGRATHCVSSQGSFHSSVLKTITVGFLRPEGRKGELGGAEDGEARGS